jgi:predicted DNA-binding transcriptional regulator YafY
MVFDGLSLTPYAWQAEVVLHTEPEAAAVEVAANVGSLERCPGGTLLRMGANDLDWIARFLASLPFTMEVRHPPELRAELRSLGRRLQRAHREAVSS